MKIACIAFVKIAQTHWSLQNFQLQLVKRSGKPAAVLALPTCSPSWWHRRWVFQKWQTHEQAAILMQFMTSTFQKKWLGKNGKMLISRKVVNLFPSGQGISYTIYVPFQSFPQEAPRVRVDPLLSPRMTMIAAPAVHCKLPKLIWKTW